MKKSILHYSKLIVHRHLPRSTFPYAAKPPQEIPRRLFVIQLWLGHPQRGERWFIDRRGDI